jgi:superfamily II DNA or RNA helicase
VFKALQPAIRYEKAQCLDLPDVMYQTREVPLSAQATAYYKELVKQMQVKAAGETISTVNAAAALTKLLQLSGGAVYTDAGNVVEFDVSPRMNVLQEVIEEASHKVIVFIPYKHTIQVIQEHLTKKGVTTEIISGDVTANARAQIFKNFQTTDTPRVLLIQPQSASHGVTLTAADTIVFWSPVMSVETYLQCVARIDRVGQKNKMTVIHLQGSEVERRIAAIDAGARESERRRMALDLHEDLGQRLSAIKIALAGLVAACRARGVALIDCQQNTTHLASFGAREISRQAFQASTSAFTWRSPSGVLSNMKAR